MKSYFIDTNAFLRIILNDIPSQAEEVQALFKLAKKKKVQLFVPQIIIFEIHFGLAKFYGFEKEEIIESMESVLGSDYLIIESRDVFQEALTLYKQKNISFADCFLFVQARKEEAELFTFDKSLKKLKR